MRSAGGGADNKRGRNFDDNAALDALNELIRNITQLTAKSNGEPMEKNNKEQQQQSSSVPTTPPTSSVATTMRVIGVEADKVAIHPPSSERINQTGTSTKEGGEAEPLTDSDGWLGTSSTQSTKEVEANQVFADQQKEGVEETSTISLEGLFLGASATDGGSGVYTEVDKDNKKVEVVYAESVKEAPTVTATTEQPTAKHLNGNRVSYKDTVVAAAAEATTTGQQTQPWATTATSVQVNSEEGEGQSPISTPPGVTTPLMSTQRRQKLFSDNKQWRREQQLQRNSSLSTRRDNVTEIGPMGASFTGDEQNDSQKELARVADALKALRNLAALCNNKCNGSSSSINGIVSSKCQNRTSLLTTSTFALDRRNRVENVLAKTHEEVAARTRAASGRRLRKLRVCVA